MKKIWTALAGLVLALSLASSIVLAAPLTNPNIPAANSALQSAPIRGNFANVLADVTNALTMYVGTVAPSAPVTGQFWRDSSTAPQPIKQYDGTSWVLWGTLNTSTHVFSPVANSTNVTVTAPITGTYGTGTVGIGLATDANFTVGGGALAHANVAAGYVLGNITTNPAEPTASAVTDIIDRSMGSTQNTMLLRGASIWAAQTFTAAMDAAFCGTQTSLLVRGASTWACQTNITTGSVDLGTPTGGNKGSGTVNAATAYYLNGNINNFGSEPCGRLTLTTAAPIMTTGVSNATTIYYTPYKCDRISVYDGTNWTMRQMSEVTNLTAQSSTGSAGPAVVAANKNYDLFVWSNGGTLTLTRGLQWVGDAVRSTTTENDLERINGVLMNKNAITNGPGADRGVYVGTVRSNASSQIALTFAAQGTAGVIGVWNMYNRINFSTTGGDGNATYGPYTSATIRQSNASAVNQIAFVSGIAEDNPVGVLNQSVSMAASTAATVTIGVQLDATTTFAKAARVGNNAATALTQNAKVENAFAPQLGWHTLSSNEQADGAQGGTFLGQSAMALTLEFRM